VGVSIKGVVTTGLSSSKFGFFPPSSSCYGLCTLSSTVAKPPLSYSRLLRKPKNARSKRALDAREPKEIEDPRTAIFVKGTHTGEVVNGVMKELVEFSAWYASETK
jgi:hypothetical protein